MTKAKICGITNLKDGLDAVKLGADYIGFVFYEKSPRHIKVHKAVELSRQLTDIKKVGLFVNAEIMQAATISNVLNSFGGGLEIIQLHGDESPEYCSELKQITRKEVWKAERLKDESSLENIKRYKEAVDAILVDAYVKGKQGGTGKKCDWDLAKKAKELHEKMILAGGLDASNVREAIDKIDPFAVDTSSGVEEYKGKKSHDKMRTFLKAAKSYLWNIVGRKRDEIDLLFHSGNINKYLDAEKSNISFYDAITSQRSCVPNLIAEFKRTSPSNIRARNPDYREDADPSKIPTIYQKKGAKALSILTDIGFKGSLEDLKKARSAVNLPILRKDFILDEMQIHEGRYFGANANLLITQLLEVDQMKEFIDIADHYGMDCLVESHDEEDLEKAIKAGAKIFGINNRDLCTFKVSLDTTKRLLPLIPKGSPIIAESGIHTYEDVQYLSDPRINAMLIGTSLMKAKNIEYKIDELLGR